MFDDKAKTIVAVFDGENAEWPTLILIIMG